MRDVNTWNVWVRYGRHVKTEGAFDVMVAVCKTREQAVAYVAGRVVRSVDDETPTYELPAWYIMPGAVMIGFD